MALSMKFGETTITVSFPLDAYLTSVSKIIDDVVEAAFMLKLDPTETDGNANYDARLNSGITKNGNTLDILITDYSNLEADKRYFVGLGVKFTGDSVFREVPLADSSKTFSFEQDVIRG